MQRYFTALFVLTFFPLSAFTQQLGVGDPFTYYFRLFERDSTVLLSPTYTLHSIDQKAASIPLAGQIHPWESHTFFANSTDKNGFQVQLYVPEWFISWNSLYPSGYNDGAMWQGVGLNQRLRFGFRASFGKFTVSVRPEAGSVQNKEFDLSPYPTPPGTQKYSAPFRMQDNIQRFGEESFYWFDWGRTFIHFEQKTLLAGISNDHIWTGPAVHNPIAYSNHAPGFPHIFVGTVRPLVTRAGALEGRMFWGWLRASEYFRVETEPEWMSPLFQKPDSRYLNGLVLSFSPSVIPGFTLGLTRSWMAYWSENSLNAGDIFGSFVPIIHSKANKNRLPIEEARFQMITYFGRWMLPEAGFEAYFEWGRNAAARSIKDFTQQPEHSRAYMMGFIKNFTLPENRLLSMGLEMTQLETSRSDQWRRAIPFYTDPMIHHGFTNKGQVIGAGIGSGSNSQNAQIRIYDRIGMGGLSLNRIVHNNDDLYRNYWRIVEGMSSRKSLRELHNVDFRYGAHFLVFLPGHWEIEADIFRASKTLNKYYRFEKDVYNTHWEFKIRYHLPGFAR